MIVCVKSSNMQQGVIYKHSLADQNAFTLVELLVGLAIICILMSVLVPGLNRARGFAQKAENTSNLRTIVKAWNSYALDNKGNFPIGVTWADTKITIINPPKTPPYSYRMWSYYQHGVSRYLPTIHWYDREAARYGGPTPPSAETMWPGYYPPPKRKWIISRGIAFRNGYHVNSDVGFKRRSRLAEIKDPSRTPLLWAYWDHSKENGGNPMASYHSNPVRYADIFEAGSARVFSGGNHFAFIDGHVEWLEEKEITDRAALQDRFDWNPRQ
jgi:prepilin-type N-terminal cleavage/methylation domain-containing protein/prepilin-type processing-associated H-X9-DG protein